MVGFVDVNSLPEGIYTSILAFARARSVLELSPVALPRISVLV